MRISALLTVACLGSFIFCSCRSEEEEPEPGGTSSNCVVFVGASITEAWNFGKYFSGYNFKKVVTYSVDKTEVWDEVTAHHPKIVVVKECAAYFYEDGTTPLPDYYGYMRRMTDLIRDAGYTPVLATVIPVDVGHGSCTQAQLDDIIEFNSWVRNYGTAQNIECMDYYNALADNQGQLPSRYHDGDGLHPNDAGYAVLSGIVIPTLERAGR